MCGICGIIPRNGTAKEDIGKVRIMNDALTHRGPDSEGYFDDSKISVGMRRLSVIDLDHGSQPLFNEDRSIMLIANGEIYNFIELREELLSRGHRFGTGSDCETIIHAYEEYGHNFIEKLRGMFAFALYDMQKGEVILARDRLGEKPLYVYETPDSLIFSSEIKSLLLSIPKNKHVLTRESVYLYFHYGYVPGTKTMFEGVRKLAPGHKLVINLKDKTRTDFPYWDKAILSPKVDINKNPEIIIREQLDEIEKIIIRSDVSVGISLSGGLDSSIIATLAAQYSKNPLHAFSVGYPGSPENDERTSAKKLADDLGLIFHDIELNEEGFVKDFPIFIESMDEPIADIAAYGYFSVSREARKEKVPVLLAGFGGDELFWGYGWVRDAARYNDLKKTIFGRFALIFILVKKIWRDVAHQPFKLIPEIIKGAFSHKIIMYELSPLWAYIRRNEKKMFNSTFLSTIERSSPYKAEEKALGEKNGLSITELITDIWLLSDCIELGDRMSMAHSIEIRLPLVDHRFYEAVAVIRSKNPKDYKLGYKYWLIQAVRDLLPSYVLDRKKKGFTPPTHQWIQHALAAYSTMIEDGYLVHSNILNPYFIKRAIKYPHKNQKFLYSVLVFELWAKKYLS
jgi:asparagine synthase (glutamine-hydrolysing)